jgi:tetraacyldisaccharide 4'-kinase
LSLLSRVYGEVAGWRRRWYARHPAARRRLPCPVVSVGNLVVGGSGKTPVVLALAELLRQSGERPAVLSRGYARRHAGRDVVIVSDGERVLEPVERSGDEPQMLARALAGVPVLVAAERFRAGREAVARFGATVLLLDDGFQHVQLARDVDLLLVSPADLQEQVLPSGTLREPLASAAAAHAVLVPGAAADAGRVSSALGIRPAFHLTARYLPPEPVGNAGAPASVDRTGVIVAVAGIARPQRFFEALREQGWRVGQAIAFPDHHWYTARDIAAVQTAARDAGTRVVMTTEKDAVRLAGAAGELTWMALPMRVSVEPAEPFAAWLLGRVSDARRSAAAPACGREGVAP